MKRIKVQNPNTPEAFDRLWREDMERGRRQFDLYRFRAMMDEITRPARLRSLRIIELGAGCSEFLSFCLNHLTAAGFSVQAVGLDYSRWAMEYMRQVDPRVQWMVGDALNTGLPAGSYDAVLCGELIEHLEDPEALVLEMARLTAPLGLFRITTLRPELQSSDAYHVWEFQPDDLLAMFRRHAAQAEIETVGNYLVVTGREPR